MEMDIKMIMKDIQNINEYHVPLRTHEYILYTIIHVHKPRL